MSDKLSAVESKIGKPLAAAEPVCSCEQDKMKIPARLDESFLDLAKRLKPTSDKVTTHAYNRMYDQFLGPLRQKDLKMFEIGLGCGTHSLPGASVKIWDNYLTHGSEIWAAEFDATCVANNRDWLGRVKTVTGDQGDPATLDRWITETGGNFDFIIDDGGHRNSQIINSFTKLWPTVKPGGLYFIEDLQVGRTPPFFSQPPVFADVVEEWIEQLLMTSGMFFPKNLIAKEVNHPIPDKVSFIQCQDEACVIGKCRSEDTKFHCK
jgi:hypothetical protein